MSPATQVAGSELIDAVIARIHERMGGSDAALAEAFARGYLRVTPGSDITHRDPVDVYASTLGLFRRVERRSDNLPSIWITTPSIDEDGWQSPHTVIDLVTDDRPFIVDSVLQTLRRLGHGVHLLVNSVLGMERDGAGRLVAVHEAGEGGVAESLIHLEVDRVGDPDRVGLLEAELLGVLEEVVLVAGDWPAMRDQMLADVEAVEPYDAEGARLLRWLVDEHFVFLGSVVAGDDEERFGLCHFEPWARVVAAAANGPGVLIDESEVHASVHRDAPLIRVAVGLVDAEGAELCRVYAGLFTNEVYSESVLTLPVAGPCVQAVMDRSGFVDGGHNERRLRYLLEQYPREELFQITPELLFDHAMGMLHLRDRQEVRIFLRRSRGGRSASALIFVPRDRFDTQVRLAIMDAVKQAFGAKALTFSTVLGESPFARMHVKVHAPSGQPLAEVLVRDLEVQLSRLTRAWEDDLRVSLVDRNGEDVGLARFAAWGAAFPAGYQARHRPAQAVAALDVLASLDDDDLAVACTRPVEVPPDQLRLELVRTGGPLTLTNVLPLLHDLGVTVLEEHPNALTPQGDRPGWIYEVVLQVPGAEPSPERRRRLEEAFLATWSGRSESDGFGRLVLAVGLDWQQVAVLRAYRRYLRQIGSTFSQSYYEQTLARHPETTRLVFELFRARFDPELAEDRVLLVADIESRLDAALDAIASLDEDRMLRSFRTLVSATVRTNAYARPWPEALAFKFDPSRIPDLPKPRPAHEIWVYSPRTEGVHLRAGSVARGGLRWSDRREDFRTEVLGLMKAQAVKNAVIVPAGAKGGFVAKELPEANPAAARAEVVRCYQQFVGALLDVTDDLVDGRAVTPERVVRWDGDDPYLVVAADKGTATFSDLANDVATTRGFWLGDAFASGGRTGYDHKALGITARGAWESVRRHLYELSVDVERDPVRVVGVGDMSGDVFGNGMLLSPHLRLVAAFDHRHVFVDPDPPTGTAFAERQRLFELPASSWADYDRSVISAGGGVFDRSAKAVAVTPQMAAALGVEEGTITPNELVSAVLRAPVELFWNGGIGTFVKASTETHAEVGDRTNDAVRVDATELRCRVVGEGGNLGLTQRARIEFASAGGRVNTDAIDNSAGVDCSDHEVNLKVLLDGAVAAGELTVRQRNDLLAEVADDVARLVLVDNVEQNLALAMGRAQAASMAGVHRRHLSMLEAVAGLDRALEDLPGDDELAERVARGEGLVQPELAVVLAYTKNHLTAEVLASDLPDSAAFTGELEDYVPRVVAERFGDRLLEHPLRREIIATVVVNRVVNRAGATMVHRFVDETAASPAQVIRAHRAVWSAFGLEELWAATVASAPLVAAGVQVTVLLELRRLAERACRWVLRHRPGAKDPLAVADELAPGVAVLLDALPELLTNAERRGPERQRTTMVSAGVPAEVARLVAIAPLAVAALDQVDVAGRTGRPLLQVADVWLAVGRRLDLGWLREQVTALPRADHWQSLARSAARDDLSRAQAELVEVVLAGAGSEETGAVVDRWLADQHAAVERYRRVVADIRASGSPDLAQLSVALRELRDLIMRVGRG
jgi:glutamate dehydrogenase